MRPSPSELPWNSRRASRALLTLCFLTLCFLTFSPATAEAYIGPGAGFALVSSFFVVLTTMLLAFLSLLIWPIRAARRWWRRRKRPDPLAHRLIVIGFDGQDPELTEKYLAEGRLENFRRLRELGGYRRLATTYPSISPVAWSSFSTGTNPGRHAIFDFMDRDPRSYLPVLSSARIRGNKRFLRLGKWQLPLDKPEIRLLRRSKPFWTILGENDFFSAILRVPITFPPDRFHGAQLSAMCTPDLLGTQGTFLLFTTRPSSDRFKEGGTRIRLESNRGVFSGRLEGPPNILRAGSPPAALELTVKPSGDFAEISIGTETRRLERKKLSDWVTLRFPIAPGLDVTGLTRVQVLELGEHVSVYLTPISLDPEQPAMPISHPSYYSRYLSKKIGPFCTLGLAEDTWALNEGVTDEATFLEQTLDIDREREAMFFSTLEKVRRGTVVCVFDATDRIQHMFWHHLEDDHPAKRTHAERSGDQTQAEAIRKIYERNDELVGKALGAIGPNDVLLVISDHGMKSFRRGVNPNAWLREHGYLVLKPETAGASEWLGDVDWSKTRAFALGLTGIFLNIEGRESKGIVKPSEAAALAEEISCKLRGLRDSGTGEVGVDEVYVGTQIWSGPYREAAPDLLMGYAPGYRVSWDGATGVVAAPMFEDNAKPWSADHAIDPAKVPGILFSNRPLVERDLSILDVAPTALGLFGVEVPGHIEGKPIFDFAAMRAESRP
ncbi:MAG: alkaline phosphatase family protein [Deltaproteobacteria bacterium]|nr:alkaline phosphatase family protein [Deltaproteobacteria bacterium]